MLLAGTVVSSEGSVQGGSAPKLTRIAVDKVQFLVGCWDDGLRSSLAGWQVEASLWSSPSGLL